MNNKYRIILVIIIIGIVVGVNLQIYFNINDNFNELPDTYTWYNFAYLEIITQIGITVTWYLIKSLAKNT